MAGSSSGGYRCEFVEAVPKDLRCGVCSHVAREAQLVSCCTEVVCKTCITAAFTDKKPCPLCGAAGYEMMRSAKDQRKILALDVRCIMKDRGCEWTGKLEGLEAHLDVNTGDCKHVDVECPIESCTERFQRSDLSGHLSFICPKRGFTCQYCNFKATYEVVSNDHWPQCSIYPVPCPNACGIQAIERGDLEAHLLQCPLEEVECDFSHAGCNTKLPRQDLERHMEKSIQKHLVLMSATLSKCQEQLQKYAVHMQICSGYFPTLRVPTYSDRKKAWGWWHSPPLYTHPGGYKFRIAVNVYGYQSGYGTHISVSMDALKGEFDSMLQWPAKASITLQLLNQERDQDHLTVTKTFEWPQPFGGYFATSPPAPFVGFFDEKLISHDDLEKNSENQTRYLFNDSLFFRIKVELDDLN